MNKWQRIKFQPNLPLGEHGEKVTASKAHRNLSKEAAKEGMVLLKNEEKVLPLNKGCKIALFGKGSFDYVKGGGGSGDVTVEYILNLYEGLKSLDGCVSVFEELSEFYRNDVTKQYEGGAEPGMTVEPILSEELVERARNFTDTAIITISRFSGEGWDRSGTVDAGGESLYGSEEVFAKMSENIFEKGDFYLSNREQKMVSTVQEYFSKVIVVLNVGGMVDTEWFVHNQSVQSVLMAWQGGMEGGLAIAELLCGIGNPSGKLTDTFAKRLEDYPSTYNFHESDDYVNYTEDIYVGYRYFETIEKAKDKVNYPFGYGLSYSTFEIIEQKITEKNDIISINVKVKNIGGFAGKEVIQVYMSAPQGLLGKPAKSLVAFKKTKLLDIGEVQELTLEVKVEDWASYDDLGKVQKSAYILEKGEYYLYIGTSVRDTVKVDFAYVVEESRVIKQLKTELAPTLLKKRLLADGSFESLPVSEEDDSEPSIFKPLTYVETECIAPATRERKRYCMLENTPMKKDVNQLIDVVEGKITLEDFLQQLSDDEVAHLLGGQENTGVANTFGFGNLPEFGVPNVMTADGPAGLRINKECGVNTTAWPCATLLACSWNEEILFAIGEAGGKEVKENNIAVWLTPAVNIHRSPLCGRNFEYYSEDPYISGKLASAMVKGIQSQNIAASVKHFAFNNKESNRKNSDSRVSERAAREIYLKAFEIIVKEAEPWTIMSAYNLVNGRRASENRELLVDILRDEWGFKGLITTDWWNCAEHYKEVKAGNDIKMACGFDERLIEAIKLGALTRKEMETCAERVLELIMKFD